MAKTETTKDADLKIILLGDSAVGKSKMVERFLLKTYYSKELSTYALTMFRYDTEIDGKQVAIDFWDTAGQEEFETLHPSYYYGAHCCILCFDLTRKVTYKNLNKWYNEMRSYCPDIPCLLLANKVDVDENMTRKKFLFATENNLPLHFVSAANGLNIVRAFTDSIQLANAYHQNLNSASNANDVAELMNIIRDAIKNEQNQKSASEETFD